MSLEDHATLQRTIDELRGLLVAEQHELRDLAKRVWSQQELERNQLARDLHDGVGQSLAILTRRLKVKRNQSAEDEALYQLAHDTMEDIRVMARLMRPTVLDDLGLPAALKWLSRTLFDQEAIQCELDIDIPGPLPDEVCIMVFRVAQEALTNTLKHARASEVRLFACHHQSNLRLDIVDNGCGFDVLSDQRGIGLRSMRDRAAAFNAVFEVVSRRDNGTHVSLQVAL